MTEMYVSTFMINQCYQSCFSWDSILHFDIELINIDWLVVLSLAFMWGLSRWEIQCLKVFLNLLLNSRLKVTEWQTGVLTSNGLILSRRLCVTFRESWLILVYVASWRQLDRERLRVVLWGEVISSSSKRRSGHLYWNHCPHNQNPKQKVMDG